MNPETIIRAWKDPTFRASLSPELRSALPELPPGKPMTELGEDELSDVVGGLPVMPTPPIIRPTTTVFTITKQPSAVDACPSCLGCPYTTVFQTSIVERF